MNSYLTLPNDTRDSIPLEDVYETQGPNDAGMMTHVFYAFNTIITLQAYDKPERCRIAFDDARTACRTFERLFSRMLPHSDIARLNAANGAPIVIASDTAALLSESLHYCADSKECFDITIGAALRLWDFHKGLVPELSALQQALAHVDWRGIHIKQETEKYWIAWLDDPYATVDVGGIAKGWIADRIESLMLAHGLESFIVNLGGNVIVHGHKPNKDAWHIGLQDPRNKGALVGSVAVCNASAVTSGIYERCFERNGIFYHHILSPQTGFPVQTDIAGVTVISRRSTDAEGYSTTLLALGSERGRTFVHEHPIISAAYFIDKNGEVWEA